MWTEWLWLTFRCAAHLAVRESGCKGDKLLAAVHFLPSFLSFFLNFACKNGRLLLKASVRGFDKSTLWINMIFCLLNSGVHSVSTKPRVLRLIFSQGRRKEKNRRTSEFDWVCTGLLSNTHNTEKTKQKQDQQAREMWFMVLASDLNKFVLTPLVSGYSGAREGYVKTNYCLFDTTEPQMWLKFWIKLYKSGV